MNYTWKLKSLTRKRYNDLDNVVVETFWEKWGTDENGHTGSFNGVTSFNLTTVDPDNFVKYEDLTEEIILGWIQDSIAGDYEDYVNEKISEIQVVDNFPWQQNVGISTSSPPVPAPENNPS